MSNPRSETEYDPQFDYSQRVMPEGDAADPHEQRVHEAERKLLYVRRVATILGHYHPVGKRLFEILDGKEQ